MKEVIVDIDELKNLENKFDELIEAYKEINELCEKLKAEINKIDLEYTEEFTF